MGGYQQTGNYLIGARFNEDDFIKRIEKIAMNKNKIHLYNHDVRSFIKRYIPIYIEKVFANFYTQYYSKSKRLYKIFFC